ncbi:hypothetical protein NMY22_g4476 [Coprinellus aureogranulatus]|nr:hypothetical protein NMY22_g4476 [Coprinellus aureogranulatus]
MCTLIFPPSDIRNLDCSSIARARNLVKHRQRLSMLGSLRPLGMALVLTGITNLGRVPFLTQTSSPFEDVSSHSDVGQRDFERKTLWRLQGFGHCVGGIGFTPLHAQAAFLSGNQKISLAHLLVLPNLRRTNTPKALQQGCLSLSVGSLQPLGLGAIKCFLSLALSAFVVVILSGVDLSLWGCLIEIDCMKASRPRLVSRGSTAVSPTSHPSLWYFETKAYAFPPPCSSRSPFSLPPSTQFPSLLEGGPSNLAS